MSDRDETKRRGIDGAAKVLREQNERAGGRPITQEQSKNRVRDAVIRAEQNQNPRR